jgi:predicted phage replisome organizer
MAEIKWIKIVTDMFDDEKILLIETLPEGDSILVIWLKLLCLAGKQNNSGVFSMQNGLPYTDKMLSIIFRRKETTVQLALQTFKSFGMIEIIENTITIPNWGKHQNFDTIERKNEYMRGYMQDYRAKQKQIASGSEVEKSKSNCKTNSKSNVSCADKIRLDKIRLEKDNINTKEHLAKKDVKIEIPDSLQFDDFLSTWSDWLNYRKEIKKTLSATGQSRLLKKCEQEGINRSIEAMSLSMENGWQGLFWDKLKTVKHFNQNGVDEQWADEATIEMMEREAWERFPEGMKAQEEAANKAQEELRRERALLAEAKKKQEATK